MLRSHGTGGKRGVGSRGRSAWGEGEACKARVLVLCAYLRPGRDKGRSRYVMQPISGLHVASLLEQNTFEVRLYHEDWHGSFETSNCGCYDLDDQFHETGIHGTDDLLADSSFAIG